MYMYVHLYTFQFHFLNFFVYAHDQYEHTCTCMHTHTNMHTHMCCTLKDEHTTEGFVVPEQSSSHDIASECTCFPTEGFKSITSQEVKPL